MSQAIAISDDALKLLVAEHGVRGTARLLELDERQTMAFRQRAQRGKWMQDPAIAAIRQRAVSIAPANVARPIVSAVSPQAALASELASLGQQTRLSLAKGMAKAGAHIQEMPAEAIVADAGNVKSIAQTADLVHGWKDSAPQVKIRLDVLNANAETPVFEVKTETITAWEPSDNVDDY